MSACEQCGAPIGAVAKGSVVRCKFCGTDNTAPPEQVEVPLPVQVVHNVVQVVAGDAPRELRCPHCGKRLVGVVVHDVALNGCGGCGGIWIDNESGKRVLAAPQRVFGELAQRAAENAAKKRPPRAPRLTCPVCPAVLDRVTVHFIDLDVCGEHGTWFDAWELKTLTQALRGENTPAALLRGGAKPSGIMVPCAVCRAPIDAGRALIGEQGPTCDGCMRARQAELAAAGDALQHQAGAAGVAGAVAAVLLGLAAGAAASRD